MKKTVIWVLAALTLLCCARMQTFDSGPKDKKESRVAMGFGVYLPQTKAGSAGEMNDAKLKATGFGVFAFEQAGGYDASIKPNFMYNQLVEWKTSKWTYEPVKYWPNQLADDGATDGQGASSEEAHMVSFFAYAPYVEEAGGTEGITAMSAGSLPGDPTVTYKVSEDLNKNVDLVWGTSNGAVWTNVAGGDNTVEIGLPYIDLQKPKNGTNVNFRFYHALAQLNLTAVSSYNVVGAGGTAKDGVKITIKEVKLTVPGMYDQGVLNLNNTEAKTPLWDFSAAKDSTLTLVVSGDKLHTNVLDAGDKEASAQPAGVTATEGPVLATNKYFTLLPREVSTNVTVKVTYYVTTDDPGLDDGYSRVENAISKTITFPNGFRYGTKNSIKMILGLSEVGLTGVVADWETNEPIDVNLPQNAD
ncbi:MAG: fimbrillin family protein [Bacteroidales bacterium]|nr:fimbrillin family protein [Bacteroidales bacterium]